MYVGTELKNVLEGRILLLAKIQNLHKGSRKLYIVFWKPQVISKTFTFLRSFYIRFWKTPFLGAAYRHHLIIRYLDFIFTRLERCKCVDMQLFVSTSYTREPTSRPAQVNDVSWKTARMQRKILGIWKQYYGRELAGGTQQLPLLSRKIRSESLEKFKKF